MFRLKVGRKRANKRVKKCNKASRGRQAYLRFLLMGDVLFVCASAKADLPSNVSLPVPCTTTCASAGGANSWVSSGQASLTSSGTTLYVNQQSDKAILNWQSFNIGTGHAVQFNQPNTGSVALNRIYQADPSRINGVLSANGQVFLINRNGMVFGPGASVDVNSLTASTLNVSDETFNVTGILQAIKEGKAAFIAEGPMGSVVIENGAQLRSAEGGRIMVLAPVIENRGLIETPEGQAILAASQDKVWLKAASKDDNLRGLLVEVGTGGDVRNLGEVIAKRGNISLMGFAVNQDGLLSATTAVTSNGSIKLVAQDKTTMRSSAVGTGLEVDGVSMVRDGKAAQVTFGANSRTEVLPDKDDTSTAVEEQKQVLSSVSVLAKEIQLKQNASIVVTGGNVTLTATANPLQAMQNGTQRNDSRIVLEQGSLIDVSGTTDTKLAMSRNELEIELRGNELKDAPFQRNGVLRGKKVIVDAREGTPLTDISSALAAIERGVDERLSAGGTLTLASEGDVVLAKGATVDISGGEVAYEAGWMHTTQLLSGNKIYDISDADPNRLYDGVLGEYVRLNPKWGETQVWRINGLAQGHYEEGYVEGKNAGNFKVIANSAQLDGEVLARVTQGSRQDSAVQMGGLELDFATILGGSFGYIPTALTFTHRPASNSFQDSLDPSVPITLDPRLLLEGGVGRLTVRHNGEVHVSEGTQLTLPAGGELYLSGSVITVDGTITAPAGTVVLQAIQPANALPANRSLAVGAQGLIDVSGLWFNTFGLPWSDATNRRAGTAVSRRREGRYLEGGAVTLNAKGDLLLAAGSVIDADGGASVDAQGKLHAGKGGKIQLTSRAALPEGSVLRLDGDLHAYALEQGGRLSIEANALRIADAVAGHIISSNETVLTPDFFQRGGFSDYVLTSNLDGITVAAGTVIKPQAKSSVIDSTFLSHASGEDLSAFSQVMLLPEAQRSAVNLSLTLDQMAATRVKPAHFVLETGARIETETGSAVTLTSDQSIDIDGLISAPSGSIDLRIKKPRSNETNAYFLPEQGIYLSNTAQLLSRGAADILPNKLGQTVGQVLDGGQINLTADRGHIITETGSLIDVSGTSATVHIRPYGAINGGALEQVASNAGSVYLSAAEGMRLAGDFVALAGAKSTQGGQLTVVLDATQRVDDLSVIPVSPYLNFDYAARNLVLSSSALQLLSLSALQQPEGKTLPQRGQAVLNTEKVEAGGFDVLNLRVADLPSPSGVVARGKITLDHVDSTLRRSIALDASLINSLGGDSHLGAAYVVLKNSNTTPTLPPVAIEGEGVLAIDAGQIDLVGHVTLQGWQETHLSSEGDMRLSGLLGVLGSSSKEWRGSLNSYADLQLQAARIFPATLTQYQIQVTGPDGELRVLSASSPVEGPLLSAGGTLSLKADTITQAGVLQAPLGQINFEAGKQLVLAAGSFTSTSAEGQLIPFGQTQLGIDWIYPVNQFSTLLMDAPPVQNIALKAPVVRQENGAVINVSGGGDLLAYEFVPGLGGSLDVLAPENSANTFAIIPTMQGYGPHDPMIFTGTDLNAGDRIHLAAGSALPAGDYLLLPARYALLPGAYLVTLKTELQDFGAGHRLDQLDGSVIVAGYRTVAGTDIRESRWSAYAVAPGSIARTRSEYQESFANEFFSKRAAKLDKAAPLLPRDAGYLGVNVTTDLQLDGELWARQLDGRGARVDLEADTLVIVANRGVADGTVQITADSLNVLGAESLFLGGHRSTSGDTTHLLVSASKLKVGEGVVLDVPELLLGARDEVRVASGAHIGASGKASDTANNYTLQGNGALLQLSGGGPVQITRTNANGTAGDLYIEQDATLTANGSMYLESSHGISMDGLLLMDGGSLTFDANRISLGDAPDQTTGLVLTQNQLNSLHVDSLTLISRGTVDFYGTIDLSMQALTVAAAGMVGYGDALATIDVDSLELKNLTSVAAVSVADNASLQVNTRVLRLGEGAFAIDGFARTELSATQGVKLQKKGEFKVDGELTLNTPLITADSGADTTLAATGVLRALALPVVATEPALTQGLGARIALTGRDVILDTNIQLPSGEVSLKASQGDVQVLAGASIDVSGQKEYFADKIVATPAGRVFMQSDSGNVRMDQGATIALRSIEGGDTGQLVISAAAGEWFLGASLDAHSDTGNTLGAVKLDLGSVADFSQLNSRLNDAGFGGERVVRVRNGHVEIAENDRVQAEHLQLTADEGALNVHGQINAASLEGGHVLLQAKQDVHLYSTARIDARATGANEAGGRVVLSSTQGELLIDAADDSSAAVIDVSGTRVNADAALEYVGGKVVLRAKRVGNDVAVNTLLGRIKGAESIAVEAVETYSSTLLDQALQEQMHAESSAYMAHANTIKNRLGMNNDPRFHLRSGIEVVSSADLLVSDDWDFSARDSAGDLRWRYGDDAGVLTLRAAKALVFENSLMDGIETNAETQLTGQLMTGEAWSYRLVAGADLNSADVLALNKGHGKLVLDKGVQIHTGSGDIELASGGDLDFADSDVAVFSAGSSAGHGTLEGDWLYLFSGNYPVRGGNVTLTVAGDFQGAGTEQLISDWLHRMGNFGEDLSNNTPLNTAWAVNFRDASDERLFKQGLGAFGGGRLKLDVDGHISQLSAVVATTGRPEGVYSGVFDKGFITNEVKVLGGGGVLEISAGGDINGGVFFIDGGKARIRAGKSIQADNKGIAPVVAIGNGAITLQSHDDLTLQTVLNSTLLPQSQLQPEQGFFENYFFRYGENSAVTLNSLSGDVTLRNNFDAVSQQFPTLQFSGSNVELLSTLYPGTLSVAALQGDIVFESSLTLFPTHEGNLVLLADGDITGPVVLHMSDADTGLFADANKPVGSEKLNYFTSLLSPYGTNSHAPVPMHKDDVQPVSIVARKGNVQGSKTDAALAIFVPKQAQLVAGKDVRNVSFSGQHVSAKDVTQIIAGRDILYSNKRGGTGQLVETHSSMELGGPGELLLRAGRDIDLGTSNGVVTHGNTRNLALEESGASITMEVGAQNELDFDAYLTRYAALDAQLFDVLAAAALNTEGNLQQNKDDVLALVARMTPEQKRQLALPHFYAELAKASRRAAQSQNGADYQEGYDAIATLLGDASYQGDLRLYFSRIQTLDGGDINLLVPGGLINAGLAVTGGGFEKTSDKLGIVAVRSGDVGIYLNKDMMVNQSRVFALDGGDIMIWSQEGNIDAGRGAKSALAVPATNVSFDPSTGAVILDFPPAIAGSGIRNAAASAGVKPGSVTLAAPKGVVIANDAGIKSGGDIVIPGLAEGLDNISAGGSKVGDLNIQPPAIAMDVANAGNSASQSGDGNNMDDLASSVTPLSDAALAFLEVEMLGFGED
jgi:filamentous hemagglutinin